MQTYAYVQTDNSIHTVIQGPDGFDPAACYRGSLPGGKWLVAPHDIEPHDTYDGKAFIQAPRSASPMTKLEFMRRFSAEERIALRSSADPVVKDFLMMFDLSEQVLIDDPELADGIRYFESLDLITKGRAAIILTV